MGRSYHKEKPYYHKVANVLAAHYKELKQNLCPNPAGNYAGRNTEDIFSDTIMFVIHDEQASKLHTDQEILKHFEYRHNMITFQVVKDSGVPYLQLDEAITTSDVTE